MNTLKLTPNLSQVRHWLTLIALSLLALSSKTTVLAEETITLNSKAEGYSGIWYMNHPSKDEYVYKYSGGMGTYCAKHKPFAVYSKEADKTFFCYGGTTKGKNPQLLHMVSFFDHKSKTVPRPTILLNKHTNDAHDNPVISIDAEGHIWIFSTSHGTQRPSYIHRSKAPYNIDEFELVPATYMDGEKRTAITNFSYMQAWHRPGKGFLCFFTRYRNPVQRTIGVMSSKDGVTWGAWKRLAAFESGHYQVSGFGQKLAGSAFNHHPKDKGVNWRTNLYYVETLDFGNSWQSSNGKKLSMPLLQVDNSALVHDYASEGLNVYMKDIRFDQQDRPVILYLTSKGYESGPENAPRTWTTARWDGENWIIHPVTTSDNNYDTGSLWLVAKDDWRIIGPSETGPQAYNPGGEVAMWVSEDQGVSWQKTHQLTSGSQMNHSYVRQPMNAHDDFFALWADGHGRKPTTSRIYFSDKEGNVYQLPETMKGEHSKPILMK
ncbi:MAG: BNR repeat-containing protein [Verrucomicrobiales bacterium]|nr:BNR repeat-containing protein [Verrucomicrobiales bacterium]